MSKKKHEILDSKLDRQKDDLSYNNMEIVKSENIKEEQIDIDSSSTIIVSSDIKCVEQMPFIHDVPGNEASLESIEYENVKKEKLCSQDTEMSIRTEINHVKVELEEHELNNEQPKSIKTEDCKAECEDEYESHVAPKSLSLSSKFSFDNGDHFNHMEIIKHEENVLEKNTSDGIGVDMEKQDVLHPYQHNYFKYEKGDVAGCDSHESHIGQIQSLLPTHKVKVDLALQSQTRKIHGGTMKHFKCRFCSFITRHKGSLKLHFTNKHNADAVLYHCFNCIYKTKVKNNLAKHYRVQHDKRSEWHKCHVCNFKTKYKNNLMIHRLKHDSSAEILHCDLCNFKTKYKQNLLQHCSSKKHCEMSDYNTIRHEPIFLTHQIKDESTFQIGIRITRKGNAKYFKCQFCEYITKYIGHLKMHFTRKHDENAELYQCFDCEYKTKIKRHLVEHCIMHHNEKTEWHQCHLCDFKTKQKYNLSDHHRSRHDDSAEIFICGTCDFKTKAKYSLQRHRRLKHDGAAEIFHCGLCDFETKYKNSLLRHQTLKHDESAEIFLCELCNFKTKHKSRLLRHHSVEHDASAEVFCCELCNFKTKYKQNLLQHHSSEHDTPDIFHCVVCDFKTKTKKYLLRHHRSKHGDAPHVTSQNKTS